MRKTPRSLIIITSLLIGLFLVACTEKVQESSALRLNTKKKALIAELEDAIPQLMEKANIPGLSSNWIPYWNGCNCFINFLKKEISTYRRIYTWKWFCNNISGSNPPALF